MRLKNCLLASVFTAGFALQAQAGVTTVFSQDFASNPLCVPSNLPGFLGGTCNWYGAQHGVTGVNSSNVPTGSGTAAWNSGPGADGAGGFIGYSPTTRGAVSLITRLATGPLTFGSLSDLTVSMFNSLATGLSDGSQSSGQVRAAIHTGGTGGQWYVSSTGQLANGAWTALDFALQSLLFTQYTVDNNLPNQPGGGTPAALPSTLAVDWVGIYVDRSGQNAPNSGFVLKWDNVALTAVAVPEPASMALLGAGLLGLAGMRRRKG